MCLSVFFSETAAELAEEIGQLALFLGAMANINWPGLLAWSTKYHDGTAPSQFKQMSEEDRRFLEQAMEEAFGHIEDPNQVMAEAGDQLRSETRTEESVTTALEVIDRCCDDPDCARNADKLDVLQALLDLLPTYSGSVRNRTFEILALLFSNNPNIQAAGMKRGSMNLFLQIAQESKVGSDDRSKSFRALVALVRNVEEFEKLLLEQEAARELLLACLSLEELSGTREKATSFLRSLAESGSLKPENVAPLIGAISKLFGHLEDTGIQYKETLSICAMQLATSFKAECTELQVAVEGRISQLMASKDPEAENELECFPGQFAPFKNTPRCYPCPAGASCPDFGTTTPFICPPGTFREPSLGNGSQSTISCEPCAAGTCALSTKSGPPKNPSDGQPEPGFFAAWKACKGEERRQLVVLSISGAALNLGFGVVIPALPVLSQELGFGATGVGLLLAAPSLARVIFNLPAGALVDSFGRVPCMIAGEMFAALGCLGTGLALSLNTMLPVRFMGGTGAALAASGSAAYLADLTERPHLKPMRGTILGAQGGLVAAAYVVGPAVGGALIHFYSAQTAYCSVAALIGVCGGAYATLPETRPKKEQLLKNSFHLASAAKDWKHLLQDPRQQALFAANLALFLNYSAMVTVMPLQAHHLFGLGAGEIGALFSAGSAIGILLAPVIGNLSDKYGRVPLIAPSAALCGIGCFAVAISHGGWMFFWAYMLWSIGEAALAPLLSAYAADIAPKEHVGAALSLSRQAGDLVFFLAPPLLGFMYDTSPGHAAMSLTSAMTVVSLAWHTGLLLLRAVSGGASVSSWNWQRVAGDYLS
eukprot:symbB.v1.2.019575.t3/scaffold1605.1/size109642/3